FHRNLRGIRIIAAYDHITIDIFIAVQYIRRNVVECRCDRNALRNQLRRLLRSRTLPNANGASGASAHARSQWNGSIDQDAARTNRGLQLLQQRRLSLERHGEHHQIASGTGSRTFHPRNWSIRTRPLTDRLCCLLCPCSIARPDDDGLSRTRPAQREAHSSRTSTTDHRDGAAHANSRNALSKEFSGGTDSTGSLIFIREYFV